MFDFEYFTREKSFFRVRFTKVNITRIQIINVVVILTDLLGDGSRNQMQFLFVSKEFNMRRERERGESEKYLALQKFQKPAKPKQ